VDCQAIQIEALQQDKAMQAHQIKSLQEENAMLTEQIRSMNNKVDDQQVELTKLDNWMGKNQEWVKEELDTTYQWKKAIIEKVQSMDNNNNQKLTDDDEISEDNNVVNAYIRMRDARLAKLCPTLNKKKAGRKTGPDGGNGTVNNNGSLGSSGDHQHHGHIAPGSPSSFCIDGNPTTTTSTTTTTTVSTASLGRFFTGQPTSSSSSTSAQERLANSSYKTDCTPVTFSWAFMDPPDKVKVTYLRGADGSLQMP